jgi:hypothetical protein
MTSGAEKHAGNKLTSIKLKKRSDAGEQISAILVFSLFHLATLP